MKKLLLILFFTVSINALAQDKDRHEKIKALKIAFISDRLDLTASEAQKFWPIYNAYETETQKLRRETVEKFRKVDFESMNEQDAKKHLEAFMLADKRKHELRQKFVNDLLIVLPAKKIIILKATEDAFNKRMMEQFKKRRESFKKDRP